MPRYTRKRSFKRTVRRRIKRKRTPFKRAYRRRTKVATRSSRTARVQDASYIAKTKTLMFTFQKDFAINPDPTVKTFNRFSINTCWPGQPIGGVWPVESAADGWKANTGTMGDSTTDLDTWITSATFTAADRGKYRQAVVVHTDVTITAIPFGDVMTTSEGVTTQVRSYESLLTVSKSTMPVVEFYSGLGSNTLFDGGLNGANGQNMARMPMTKQGVTRVTPGGNNKASRITMSYTPKNMNALQAIDKFLFTPTTAPSELDFIHVSLLPINPSKNYVPVPHRFNVQVKYKVRLSEVGSLQQTGGIPG